MIKKIAQLIDEGKTIVEIKKKKAKRRKHMFNIPRTFMEATVDKMEEFDEWLDNWLRDSKSNPLIKKNPLSYFKKHEMNLGHLRFVEQFYRGAYEELQELNNLPAPKKQDEMQKQLVEGYATYSKKEIKELTDFYKRLFDGIDIIKAEKKQTRAVRKPQAKNCGRTCPTETKQVTETWY